MTLSPLSLNLFSLAGKTALVTGASRGIGFAIADGLAGAGANVIGIARSPGARTPFANPVTYMQGDVSDDVQALIQSIGQQFGRIDILVNAAGITLPDEGNGIAAFERTLQVNLHAPYLCCLAARPFMSSGASIINVTSIGSVLGMPGNPAYNASKGGLRQLTRSLALDYGPAGIRVNALAPGYIETDMTTRSFSDPDAHERRRAHTCLGRWGKTEDLVGAAIFLASDASSYVTGQDLFVDGGWTAKGLL